MALFLRSVLARDPQLLQCAAWSHRQGIIPPDTHVLDLDALEANVRQLADAGERTGLKLFFMAKQLGRNPDAVARILAGGMETAVCVEFDGAVRLHTLGTRIGHLGHLVQIPDSALARAVAMQPEAVTVFSFEKAASLARAAAEQGVTLNLLLRVVGDGDFFYSGQEGGVAEDEALSLARRIDSLPGVRVAGVTSFPCLGYDRRKRKTVILPNTRTVQRAATALAEGLGRAMEYVIMPGMNTSSLFELLKELGATHAEPGHAMTGTTPLHVTGGQPEIPAIVYVSEVSHVQGGLAYCYSAGLYRRAQAEWAITGADPADVSGWERSRVKLPTAESIWYYSGLKPAGGLPPAVGQTVLMAPRAQLFNVRSNLAVVAGLSTGQPRITLYRPDDTPSGSVVWDRDGSVMVP